MDAVGLETPLTLCVGKAAVRRLSDGGLSTVRDLVYYSPRRYYSWGRLTNIQWLKVGEEATLLVQVVNANLVSNRSGQGVRLMVDVTDGTRRLTCTFFAKNRYMLAPHQRLLKPGSTVLVSGKIGEFQGKLQMVQPEFEELEDSSPEAVARRAGRPIPIYKAVGGLPSWKVSALIGTVLERLDDSQIPEVIPDEVRARYSLMSAPAALRNMHQPEATVDWETAKRTLAWEEALVLQTALLSGRRDAAGHLVRKAHPLPPHDGGAGSDEALINGLPFSLTESQIQAWGQISADLALQVPMQRLLQADVGAGKTVMALLAMVSAVENGFQAALLAPTEVLARQHYSSLGDLLTRAGLDVPLHLLTGKRSQAEKNEALMRLAAGEAGIVVGTHALIQEGVEIPQLALLVVDEQHRFGVAQREYLREGREWTPHLLVMTATPIPRTIAMTVFGDLDVTLMKGMPPGRLPVETHLVSNTNAAWMKRIWSRAKEEVEKGGRVYVVCPRIDGGEASSDLGRDGRGEEVTIEAEGDDAPGDGTVGSDVPAAEVVAENLRSMPELDGIRVGLAHGRRSPEENAAAFSQFASGEAPILVATTVIEVGVDVPEATLMIVLGAQRFGLSQLHQLRGRVGRSTTQSVCLLVHSPTQSPVTEERLDAIAKTTDGFTLAEIDLRLRSEGDVLGQSQSGRFSGLKFLSVRSDGATIAAARGVARSILADDPALLGSSALASAVQASLGTEAVWLERN